MLANVNLDRVKITNNKSRNMQLCIEVETKLTDNLVSSLAASINRSFNLQPGLSQFCAPCPEILDAELAIGLISTQLAASALKEGG
jgi:hypothetical protein